MPTPDLAIQNLFLEAAIVCLRTAFRTGTYSQRPTQFRREAPTVPTLMDAAKSGGGVFQWCESQPKDYAGTHQQRNMLMVNLYGVVASTRETQESIGIELLADFERIVISQNPWRITVPATGRVVPVAVQAVGSYPTNANVLPELAGGHLLLRATYQTALGNPRREPGGIS